jgi:uncharacterized repeat protein (TIGR03837 family)
MCARHGGVQVRSPTSLKVHRRNGTQQAMTGNRNWDIFCTLVDNYGDIGVCWRLARQLATEFDLRVRLWVDDLARFARINPGIDPAVAVQSSHGVEVRLWRTPFADSDIAPGVADVVIEAFACELPEPYLIAMVQRLPQPVWINLEYLSAESWVSGCHGLPSPHPRLPLTKYFFFPGLRLGTGGLLAEHGLRDRFCRLQADNDLQAAFWQGVGLAVPRPDVLRFSLFAYENHAIPALLDTWVQSEDEVLCLIPEGRAAGLACTHLGSADSGAGTAAIKGNLEMRVLPFVEQVRYDELLALCDCNFVRGEDSFVRAQWAARPMVWQIYPQEEGVHWRKLSAFLDLYCEGLEADASKAVRAFWGAWNDGVGAGEAWLEFWRQRAVLEAHAVRWAERLAAHGDLAHALVDFCNHRLK